MDKTEPKKQVRLDPSNTVFLQCDVQKTMESMIWKYPAIVKNSARLLIFLFVNKV